MMALYKTNELLLFPGLALLGWSGLGYLVLNNVCVSIMGKFAGLSVIIFSGTFDASSATFLVLSKLTGTFGNSIFLLLQILKAFRSEHNVRFSRDSFSFRSFSNVFYDAIRSPWKRFCRGKFLELNNSWKMLQ